MGANGSLASSSRQSGTPSEVTSLDREAPSNRKKPREAEKSSLQAASDGKRTVAQADTQHVNGEPPAKKRRKRANTTTDQPLSKSTELPGPTAPSPVDAYTTGTEKDPSRHTDHAQPVQPLVADSVQISTKKVKKRKAPKSASIVVESPLETSTSAPEARSPGLPVDDATINALMEGGLTKVAATNKQKSVKGAKHAPTTGEQLRPEDPTIAGSSKLQEPTPKNKKKGRKMDNMLDSVLEPQITTGFGLSNHSTKTYKMTDVAQVSEHSPFALS